MLQWVILCYFTTDQNKTNALSLLQEILSE